MPTTLLIALMDYQAWWASYPASTWIYQPYVSRSDIDVFEFYDGGAILGFLFETILDGLIFLGNGGAYLIGHWIAAISVLLIARHDTISPWFALLVNAYPILETPFTIYRRKIHQGKSPGRPDGIHFHSPIFRRIVRTHYVGKRGDIFIANAMTAPYLWTLTSLTIIPPAPWQRSRCQQLYFLSISIYDYTRKLSALKLQLGCILFNI